MKRFSTAGLLLSGVLALSAPAAFAQPPSARCAIASFQSAPASPQKGTRRFSAKTVLELRPIVTLAPGLSRPGDILEVRFFAPTGNLYESRTFTVPTEEESEERQHRQSQDRENEKAHAKAGNPGDERAGNRDTDKDKDKDKEKDKEKEKDKDDLSRNDLAAPPLLVGGTAISSSSIFGTWRAEIWTGAGARRRACTSTFEITR